MATIEFVSIYSWQDPRVPYKRAYPQWYRDAYHKHKWTRDDLDCIEHRIPHGLPSATVAVTADAIVVSRHELPDVAYARECWRTCSACKYRDEALYPPQPRLDYASHGSMRERKVLHFELCGCPRALRTCECSGAPPHLHHERGCDLYRTKRQIESSALTAVIVEAIAPAPVTAKEQRAYEAAQRKQARDAERNKRALAKATIEGATGKLL